MNTHGKCARTACPNMHAPCEHRHDHRFYCVPCARKINDHNPATPPLVTIPDLDERRPTK